MQFSLQKVLSRDIWLKKKDESTRSARNLHRIIGIDVKQHIAEAFLFCKLKNAVNTIRAAISFTLSPTENQICKKIKTDNYVLLNLKGNQISMHTIVRNVIIAIQITELNALNHNTERIAKRYGKTLTIYKLNCLSHMVEL